MRPDDTATQVAAAFRAMNPKKRKAYTDSRAAAEQLTRVLASVAESAGSDATKRASVVRKLYECKDAQFVLKVRRDEKASQRLRSFANGKGGGSGLWTGSRNCSGSRGACGRCSRRSLGSENAAIR